MNDYRSFLVAYDFSEHAEAALYAAADLARRLDARLHLLHVVRTPATVYDFGIYGGLPTPRVDLAEVREAALKQLDEVVAKVKGLEIVPHLVEGGAPADSICETADDLGVDLIVMGTHGRTGLAHVFLGSVAERTLRKAHCPVLTVRAPEDRE